MEEVLAILRQIPISIVIAGIGIILIVLSAFGLLRRHMWPGLVGLALVVVALLWHVLLPITPCVEEVIQINSPAPGARVTSPATVTGYGGPAFEATLSIEVHGEDGTLVGSGNATLQVDEMSQRGPFSAQVDFTVDRVQPGRVSVFILSPRDGGIVHLSSVDVTLAP